jgi:hypothetical protein
MAAVEITISGVLYDKYNRSQQNVVLIGEAVISGLGVGGGPMPGGGGDTPPDRPRPTPPVAGWPSVPGWTPGGPGGPGMPPTEKPPEPTEPPIEWKVLWHPEEGWVVVGIPNFPHPTPSK